jgi:hypothetical protein
LVTRFLKRFLLSLSASIPRFPAPTPTPATAITCKPSPTLELQSAARFNNSEDFQRNLIMPEPTVFLSKNLPAVSVIRPTETRGAAMAAVKALTADGLFIGQSATFFEFMKDLASDADAAHRAR